MTVNICVMQGTINKDVCKDGPIYIKIIVYISLHMYISSEVARIPADNAACATADAMHDHTGPPLLFHERATHLAQLLEVHQLVPAR